MADFSRNKHINSVTCTSNCP